MPTPQNAKDNPFVSQQGAQSGSSGTQTGTGSGSSGSQQGAQSGNSGTQQETQSPQKFFTPEHKVDFVCPFCMREIPKVDLKYYCKKCGNTYEAKAEKKKWGKPRPSYWCCGDNIASNRVCPSCERELKNERLSGSLRVLPEKAYNAKNEFRLCMTGYPSSGKTQYMAQLVKYMKHSNLPWIASHFLDKETQTIMGELEKHIGASKATAVDYLRPLLFEFSNGKNSYSAVLYDIAGENFRKDEGALATKCVWNADNILLIIDPTTIMGLQNHPEVQKQVQKELDEKKYQNQTQQEGQDTRPGVTEPFQTYQMLIENNFKYKYRKDQERFRSDKKFLKKVNLAIVFSKMDLFYRDAGFPAILAKDSSYISDKKQFYGDIEAVHKAMIQWLTQVGGDAVVSNVTKTCPNARIFGVSSGSEQDPDKTNRLLDPFLWLLYQNGLF